MFTFLFDNNSLSGTALLFQAPRKVICARTPDEVAPALAGLKEAQDAGFYAAGFLTFELGLLMEPRLAPLLPRPREEPLLMFGVFDKPVELTRDGLQSWLSNNGNDYQVENLRAGLTRAQYKKKFQRTLEYIAAGDIYQLNLTFKAKFQLRGSARGLFRDLRQKQHVSYGALIETGASSILSLSPELFIEWDGERILTRPMKGTAPRGLTTAADERLQQWLSSDVKSRAENLMIVDLMRNDLSRIAKPGSVRVPDLFTVEAFETVLQMTSGVEAQLSGKNSFPDLLRAIYPPGSITGAPKVRAIEIIEELEDEPRGVYTGAIGFLRPHAGGVFNVAIRTLHIDGKGRGEIGIGSGLVQDSHAESEYEECLLKLKFLTEPPIPEFELIETLRFDSGKGYALLERHLSRLKRSAMRFNYSCDETSIAKILEDYAAALDGGNHRVRLTLSREGATTVTSTPLPPPSKRAMTFAIASQRMDPNNLYLYHKTTNRRFYDDARVELNKATGCDEAVFLNNRGELTEGSFTNLFLELGGKILTPAADCGLLPGTLREELIERGEVSEAVLRLADLERASAVWLGNSVRELVPAQFIAATEAKTLVAM